MSALDDTRSMLILSLFCTYVVISHYSVDDRYDRESRGFNRNMPNGFVISTIINQEEEIPIKKNSKNTLNLNKF